VIERLRELFRYDAETGFLYWLNPQATKDRTRGADPRNFILKMPLKELMINRVLPEWIKLAASLGYEERSDYRLDIEMRNYMTAGAACASRDRFKLIGRWCDVKRKVNIHDIGTKRAFMLDFENFYCSGKPVRGVIDAKKIERIGKILDISKQEVARIYRSGVAFRCYFLVPSIPMFNHTPDVLSLETKPEWLDPDFDDGEENEPWNLTQEDRETSEILIGG
jgi:hypothetical protein